MCTEMALMGKRYTPFETIGAYVTLLDIPAHIVDLLNANGKNIGVDVEIGTRDVWKFLNDVLRRYYGTPLWMGPDRGEMETNPEGKEAPQDVDQKYSVEELLQGGSTATANEEEHDIKEVIYDIFEDDEESVASVESSGSEYKPEGQVGFGVRAGRRI
ncbi:hypothetical protein OSTOST_04782 [Ostertagia ostertagi]